MKENYQNVIANTKAVQKSVNESAGVGLNPILADYDAGIADEISDSISRYEDVEAGISAVANDIVVQSQKYADSSMRKNAEFQSNSGMEVLVTREYDDVGVHTTDKGGGEVCQWCLSRCGTDVPYDEAYQRGMFERHPGCGCVITYKTKKGTFRQGRGDWETNNWHTVREEKEREKRIEKNKWLNNPKRAQQQLRKTEAYTYAYDLVNSAEGKDKIITSELKQIVEKGNGHLEELDHRIKGVDSLTRKLIDKSMEKNIPIKDYALQVTDVLRYTDVSEKEEFVKDFFIIEKNLKEKGYTLIEVTNTFTETNVSYKGINTLVKNKDGYVFELQFHTPKSFEVKKINHKLYEEVRLRDTSQERKRELINMMIENSNAIEIPNGIEKIKNVR